ncbi:MAG: glycosyltransferase family 87 protein [Terracidiphilus sp.]
MLCWGALLVCFVLPFCIVVVSSHRPPDGDFTGFYSLGEILKTHPPRDLYDFDLQMQTCVAAHQSKQGCGVSPYPPFIGLMFWPFALLPYWAAYLLWSVILLVLYAAGLAIMLARFFPQEPLRRSLIFCLAFSYCPFILNTAASGQLAAIGFFALAVVLREDDLDHCFRSGLALSICAYKPTLLVLLLPMLLVTRRFRTLLGFATGVAALALGTTAILGTAVWPGFVRAITLYGRVSVGLQSYPIRNIIKWIDFTSFSFLLHGGRSWPVLALLLGIACWAVISLFRAWWRSPQSSKPFNSVLWAATITWTLLLNVYVPVYDSILIVLAIIVTAGALKQLPNGPIHRWFTAIWVAILASSWFTVALAAATGVQVLTLLIASFGTLEFAILHRIENQAEELECEPLRVLAPQTASKPG